MSGYDWKYEFNLKACGGCTVARPIGREKVIKGLECCSFAWNIDEPPNCKNCPYADEKFGTCQIPDTPLIEDALALLKADQAELIRQRDIIAQLQAALDLANGKLINMGYEVYNCDDGRDALESAIKAAQEPRVLTLEEVEDALDTVLWVDRPQIMNSSSEFALLASYSRKHEKTDLWFIDGDEITTWSYSDYGKTWRCWSSRPTDEQKEAVPWKE